MGEQRGAGGGVQYYQCAGILQGYEAPQVNHHHYYQRNHYHVHRDDNEVFKKLPAAHFGHPCRHGILGAVSVNSIRSLGKL